MKPLLLTLCITLLAVLAGCGEDRTGPTLPSEQIVFIQDSIVSVLPDGGVVQVVETIYGTLDLVDTAGTMKHQTKSNNDGWVMSWSSALERFVSITHRYAIDSTTYDTICYERKECEVGE